MKRSPMRAAATLSLLLGLAVAAGVVESQDIERGRDVYKTRCYYCHGYSGDARTVAASVLEPPPRDFTSSTAPRIDRDQMLSVVRDGRAGTAMQGFSSLLDEDEIAAVVDYIRSTFMSGSGNAMRYHSEPNGWTGDAYRSPAAAFAMGRVSVDTPWEHLSEEQRLGFEIFQSACVSCHARGPTSRSAQVDAWRNEAVTFPIGNYVEHDDGTPRPATAVFDQHEHAPSMTLSERQQRGADIFERTCSACHAANGSGRNWTGSFLDPPPPDFTRPHPERAPSALRLEKIIAEGLEGTSMPASRDVLSDDEIVAVRDYLQRAFARFAATRKPPAQGVSVPDRRSEFQDPGTARPRSPRWRRLTLRSAAATPER